MVAEKPNILWIMSDQLNPNALGCYGNPDCLTPNIDMLAEDGVRFDHAYTTCPICMPSRLTYLSGQYPHTHGFYHNINTDNPDPRLALTRYLKETAGYSSAAVGKMHIGYWDVQVFDKAAIAVSSEQPSAYQAYLKENDLIDKETAWKKDDLLNYMLSRNGIPFEHSQSSWIAERSIEMIDDLQEPFFLWSTFSKPHPPFNLPPNPPVEYDPASLTLRPADMRAYHIQPFSTRMGVENMWDIETTGEAKFREGLAAYYTLTSMVDHNVGRIIRHLEQKGMLENTVIIFCADHGDFCGERGQIGKNATGPYEPVYRIPLLCYWKGHTGKEVIRGLVDHTDFFPSVCDLVGVDTPDWVQGESFARAVQMSGYTGGIPPFEGKESIFMEESCMLKTVRTMTHKLSYRFDGRGEKGVLYDLVRDPLESENLFDVPEYAGVRERLLRLIINHLIKTEQPRFWVPYIARPDWRWFKRFPAQMPEEGAKLNRAAINCKDT